MRQDVSGKIGIFKHMSANHTSYILRQMTPLFTLAGNYVYSPGHGSDGVYFLLIGAVEVCPRATAEGACNDLTAKQRTPLL